MTSPLIRPPSWVCRKTRSRHPILGHPRSTSSQCSAAVLVDGPFAETKELIAGYTLIQTKTREEALEWARRFPNPTIDHAECEIEVRQLFDLEDFEPNPQLQRFEAIKEINR